MNGFPVLVTTAINATAERTKILSSDSRLKAVNEALSWWRLKYPRTRLVICDGSGIDCSLFNTRNGLRKTDIECISFQNDQAKVLEYGKGWGEGQIIEFALAESKILADSDCFYKCTGKLWIERPPPNPPQSHQLFAFDYFGKLNVRRLDTRFYFARRESFSNVLLHSYLSVNESQGIDLEDAYLQRLSEFPLSSFISSESYCIRGLSGSTGDSYFRSRSVAVLRSIRNTIVVA